MRYELLQQQLPPEATAAEVTLPAALREPARKRAGAAGGYCFLLAVVSVITIIYTTYLTVLLFPCILRDRFATSNGFLNIIKPDRTNVLKPADQVEIDPLGITIFITFHLWFALLCFALVQSSRTDPGSVPAHWGFYVGEESKRRRYCRVCNVWKPDRTHHCSTCGRCVLNMDHHCPWINNCVGFFNRKFFVQILWYGVVCLSYVTIHGLLFLASTATDFWPRDYIGPGDRSFRSATYATYTAILTIVLLSTVLLGALIPFIRFHMVLLAHNSTTIETMDPSFRDHSKYDLGTRRNIEQVFGPTPLLWWLPVHLYRTRPVGDGVRWRRHYLRAINEEDV